MPSMPGGAHGTGRRPRAPGRGAGSLADVTPPPAGHPPLSLRAVLTTRLGHLVVAMLTVELLAGMQIYINQTVLPLLATELHARSHYGLVTAAAQVPAFLTMPLGGAMLARWRADRLMTALTALLCAGAVMGAMAPGIGVYVAGEVLRGLAAGALATVTMGVLVAGLPDQWRRLFLAVGSATWVVSSLLGPAYAATIASLWGWRWALVAYVPLLVVARLLMAREIRGLRVEDEGGKAPWSAALALAGGVGLIGALPGGSAWFWPGCGLGAAAALWACTRVFPAGTLRLRPGRRAAIAALAWVCMAYFALDFLVAPGAHDVLGLGAGAIGWALTAAGVCWSVVAMWCGATPARAPVTYMLRTAGGAGCFLTGGLLMAAAFADALPWWWLHVGFSVAGLGMGLTHQDTLIRCVSQPGPDGPDDGISQARAATAVTVASAAGGATLGTAVTAFVAPTDAGVEGPRLVGAVIALSLMLGATALLTRRAAGR